MRKGARGRSLGWAVSVLHALGYRVGNPLVVEALEIVRCAGLQWSPPDRSRPDRPSVGRVSRIQAGRDPLPSGRGSRHPKPVWAYDSRQAKRPRKPRAPEAFVPVPATGGNDAALRAVWEAERKGADLRGLRGPLWGLDIVRGDHPGIGFGEEA